MYIRTGLAPISDESAQNQSKKSKKSQKFLSGETVLQKRKEIEKSYKKTKTVVKEKTVGRNEPCPCGSGKKYKKCCGK